MSRHQKLDNSRNQPLGVATESTPRAKRGRTAAPQTPVEIHAHGVDLPEAMTEYIQNKLGSRVGAFALQIERISVRFDDLNGPRGGVDCECRIQVTLAGRPAIVVNERARDARDSFEAASQAVRRAVKRDLQRAGYSQGLRAARRGKQKSAPAPVEVDAPVKAASVKASAVKSSPAKSSAAKSAPVEAATAAGKTQRKTINYVASSQKLGQRARAEANSPKTRAAAAKARR